MHEIWLIRHGETEWSKSGQHTSRTDLALTPNGERQALALKHTLNNHTFACVFSSPLRRALDTARLAGFDPILLDELREWDYGRYEGLTTPQIQQQSPGWTIWTGDVPGGETQEQVTARADQAIARLLTCPGDTAIFAHGHILRVIASRWLGLSAGDGKLFALSTATVSILGHEHLQRVFKLWNRAVG